ncbi:MAG: response regulator [Lachnospiraceae bacterium]|nr:response regulator [Lachnospiraceae bacterium]
MKKNNIRRMLILGFLIILVVAILDFTWLVWYMNRESDRDVQSIAKTYIRSITAEEIYSYEAIAEIRLDQMQFLKNQLDSLREESSAQDINSTIRRSVSFRDLESVALLSQSETFQTSFGQELKRVDDMDYLKKELTTNGGVVMAAESVEGETYITWALPASYPMLNGETSIGILFCRKMDQFIEKMHLEADRTLATFLLIRRDGSYVVTGTETQELTVFDKILKYIKPIDSTPQQKVDELKKAIETDGSWDVTALYNDSERGISERRMISAVPLPGSNWYLITILPYGVLDQAIDNMGQSRFFATSTAVTILSLAILLVMILYIIQSEKQRKALEEANIQAEKAKDEAEKERATAEKAKEEAEKERSIAENAKVEADAARDEAEKERAIAEEAKEEAEKERTIAEKAKEEADAARDEAEKERAIAEEAKEEAEKERAIAEDAKVEADAARDEAEKERAIAEEAKEEADAARDEAEKERAIAEEAKEEAERERAIAEEAKEDAIYANKAKSDFLSNMSHDIRTPMNAIVGMTAIATTHIDDKERVRDCLKKITLSGKQLLGLINDVLDMSKIESGKMTLNVEALSLKQTMETMCDIVRPQIRANGQNFDIFISNILSEEVYCDSVRLNQVLLNFLSNAMKFTPKGGQIHIDLWQEPSEKGDDYVQTHFAVIDTGMGMTKEFQDKLFTAFEREDNRRVQKTQGTGLGMTISKFIVDAMGGQIQVKSEVGVGTTFHIIVDFERVTESEADMKLPGWKVLVVDDNEDLRRTAAISLEELGAKPETCRSGEEALQKAIQAHEKGEDFFAALVDYKMEGMNGIETSKKLREILGKNVPICLISAYDWTEIEDEAGSAGITGFIPKPLFKSTLYHELRMFQEGRARVKEDEDNINLQFDLKERKILLAEDNDINAEIATMILEENGAEIERAEDGKIAAEMFEMSKEGYYDVILMDLRMPHMNGIEATEAIRALKRSDAGKIPIIAMTADAFAEDAEKCLAAGMNAHLAKPIDVEQLKKTLAKFLTD